MANGNRFTGGDVQSVKLGLNSESSPYYNQNHRGVMGASGKVLFTANQWQELETQKKIYMYIMASIPVPPQLLLPLSAQSNKVSTGLRFSNGSDPEPWRCRRTDGKKWRCSKDVAPDQKYCERHAHKTRTRSRKPVETQSQNIKEHHSMISGANQQTRCNDWFSKNGIVPVSAQSKTQFELQMQSPSAGSKKDCVSKQDLMINHQQNPYIDQNKYCLNTGGTDVDVWSRIGGGDECSLTLSMQSGGNESEFDHESFQMAVGMLRGDQDARGNVFKPNQNWLNQASWAGSGLAPGGPLGEALCLGMTTSQSEPEPYSNDYSYSTTTSSSCEGNGGHGLDFSFVNRHED